MMKHSIIYGAKVKYCYACLNYRLIVNINVVGFDDCC